MSDVFLATPSSKSTMSALFVGWGLLLGYDIFLNQDNATEALDVECNNAALADVWCPFGSDSDPISFNRSQGEIDTDGDGARSPINYATAFVDLDWLYGRSTDAADEIRMFEGGYLNLTDDELPHLLPDGSWLVSCTTAKNTVGAQVDMAEGRGGDSGTRAVLSGVCTTRGVTGKGVQQHSASVRVLELPEYGFHTCYLSYLLISACRLIGCDRWQISDRQGCR